MIDTDLHCAPSSFTDLLPYLDEYWREYIADANLQLSPTLGGAYPAGAETSGSVPGAVEALREHLPGDVRHAVLTCLTAFDVSRNPYFEAALARAVNDWVREHWLARDARLRGSISVSTLDTDAAVTEIERLADDDRFVQVLLPVRGLDVRYGNARFHPVLEAAARHDLAVCLHAWGRVGSAPTPTGFTATYLEDYLSNSQVVQSQLVSLIAEGVFEKIPALRVCLAECGFSWLPSLLWRLDKEWKGIWREVPWVKQRPSEYVYQHVRATTQPAHLPTAPQELEQVLEMLRPADWLVYASDRPHYHGDGADRLLAALDDSAREAILWRNAEQLYRNTYPTQ
ncbi:amidohydrolase family protein [Saccharomonospora sp. NPDC046836]|uniref:amidohydrolase family protein n=1 Tax=Saccharomonospora sp. NPDC046836 TaxID=3156921 RepID=UPI0033C9E994